MPDSIGRAEFTLFCERVYRELDTGFSEIRHRLDTLNNRTLKGELEGENHRVRLDVLETPRRRRADHAGEAEQWASAFTKREYALMTLGFAVIMALIKLVEFLGGKAWTGIVGS